MDALGLREGAATLSVAAGKNVYFFESDRPAALVKKVETKYEVASVAINGRAGKFVTGSPGDTWVRVWDLETETETGKSFFFLSFFLVRTTSEIGMLTTK
jgi:serine-threonine kinase receptor-associated protein